MRAMNRVADDERIDPRIRSMLGNLTFPLSPAVTSRDELFDLIRSGRLRSLTSEAADEAPYDRREGTIAVRVLSVWRRQDDRLVLRRELSSVGRLLASFGVKL
jgi:hypothetical protein